jgi:hypothetical protein
METAYLMETSVSPETFIKVVLRVRPDIKPSMESADNSPTSVLSLTPLSPASSVPQTTSSPTESAIEPSPTVPFKERISVKGAKISTLHPLTNARVSPNNPSDTANNTIPHSTTVYSAKMDTKLLPTESVSLNSVPSTIFKLTSAQNAKTEPSTEFHTFTP